MTATKRKPKPSVSRTEVFAMRLDPKLKYLAEIAARKQRRSLANFIEWAIDEALSNVKLVEPNESNGQQARSVQDEALKLWDLEAFNRLIKLAEHYPGLLLYEEQRIWKAITVMQVTQEFKDDRGVTITNRHEFTYGSGADMRVDRPIVRECWPTLVAYGQGNATEDDVRAALLKTAPW